MKTAKLLALIVAYALAGCSTMNSVTDTVTKTAGDPSIQLIQDNKALQLKDDKGNVIKQCDAVPAQYLASTAMSGGTVGGSVGVEAEAAKSASSAAASVTSSFKAATRVEVENAIGVVNVASDVMDARTLRMLLVERALCVRFYNGAITREQYQNSVSHLMVIREDEATAAVAAKAAADKAAADAAAAASAAAAKAQCRASEFQKCKTKDPAIYATPNQACNDPRTHYLVYRNNKIQMSECYALPVYGDCVGKCVSHGPGVVDQICREDAARNCN